MSDSDEQMDDENSDEAATIVLTQELLDSVAKVVATEWERVAGKLGYKEDEVSKPFPCLYHDTNRNPF